MTTIFELEYFDNQWNKLKWRAYFSTMEKAIAKADEHFGNAVTWTFLPNEWNRYAQLEGGYTYTISGVELDSGTEYD